MAGAQPPADPQEGEARGWGARPELPGPQKDDQMRVAACSCLQSNGGPIDGHVLELLSHHIVHGEAVDAECDTDPNLPSCFQPEVVVPGACYLEMILAGVRAHLGQQAGRWDAGNSKGLRCVLSLSSAGSLVHREPGFC